MNGGCFEGNRRGLRRVENQRPGSLSTDLILEARFRLGEFDHWRGTPRRAAEPHATLQCVVFSQVDVTGVDRHNDLTGYFVLVPFPERSFNIC